METNRKRTKQMRTKEPTPPRKNQVRKVRKGAGRAGSMDPPKEVAGTHQNNQTKLKMRHRPKPKPDANI